MNSNERFEKDGIVCAEGQLKVGDKIQIIGKSSSDDQKITVKQILNINGNEEIIINKSRNRYFITNMLLNGTSWAKQVRVIR